jgi:hypothetical protein
LRKILSVALAVLAAEVFFVSCSMSPPDTMDGTTWERSVMGQGARLEFNTSTAALTLLMAGADDIDGGSYAYDYKSGNIVFYYPGSKNVYSTGTVKGTVMDLESGQGGLWGKFNRK